MDNDKSLRDLWFCLSNDLRGLNIKPMEDYDGWLLVGPRWTEFTVYCSQTPGLYSAYQAIPDVMKGIDIADEKLVIENAPLFATVSAIKSAHSNYAPEHYAVAPPVNSRTDYQLWQESLKHK